MVPSEILWALVASTTPGKTQRGSKCHVVLAVLTRCSSGRTLAVGYKLQAASAFAFLLTTEQSTRAQQLRRDASEGQASTITHSSSRHPWRRATTVPAQGQKVKTPRLPLDPVSIPRPPAPDAHSRRPGARPPRRRPPGPCRAPRRPSDANDSARTCGSVPDVLESLVGTILSQNTSARNSTAAKRGLDAAFGRNNFEAVARARRADVVEAIKTGGLANKKAAVIQNILQEVHEKHGRYSLQHLAAVANPEGKGKTGVSDEEAMQELVSYNGVGPSATDACTPAQGRKQGIRAGRTLKLVHLHLKVHSLASQHCRIDNQWLRTAVGLRYLGGWAFRHLV
ncbi:hypothetical protein NUW54_g10602 [Trametes sanguinea]|uniref:Uncharacterized protein n=1 Tax=Trametes sanguinea TaxID=158606 RepID=A0ACC1NXC5_9APHY|nr:hypothetical protein NUW54_g10602 [Trametes sanguinea]